MKKILLISVIFAALLTACDDTVIETIEGNTIRFDNAFVSQPTRATDITIDNLTNFYVHAWMSNSDNQTACIFNSVEVTKSANDWTYGGGGRYWFADKKYEFLAFSPLNAQYTLDDTHASFIYYNNGAKAQKSAGAQDDLIVSKVDRVTTQKQLSTDDILPVSLHFHHLLSRVVFNFVNDFTTPDVKLRIEDIKLTGIANSATFEFATLDNEIEFPEDGYTPYRDSYVDSIGSWLVSPEASNHNGEAVGILFPDTLSTTPNSRTASAVEITTANYQGTTGDDSNSAAYSSKDMKILKAVGNALSEQVYIIPETIGYEQYRLTFTVTMFQGSDEHPIQIGVFNHSVALNAMTFEQGKSYKLTAKFNSTNVNPATELKPIEFTVSVTPWGEDIQNEIF